ncbi:MAG TPA: RpiB/LacA/LacB family sugar-phosphate isomerase [Tepidisphaeraceae bacterium]|nr:RpiB/LacA/LacB family sugar-phosphate isomerase [Tepidisphaeraceae bacterium]
MIVTARQIEDLYKSGGSNGHVTLPYRARLTPLASDFIKARKLVLGYSDISAPNTGASAASAALPPLAVSRTSAATEPGAASTGSYLWWCDGACGPAKAALMSEEKQSNLKPLDKQSDVKQIVPVIKALATEVKAGRSAGGILMVQNAAAAAVFANRCPSLRAVVGTCLDAVEQGVRQVAANVLIIEYPYKTLQQMKNMLSRFVKLPRSLPEDVRRQIEELASCG